MSYDTCVAFTLDIEKGLVDNPKDPGGRTSLGITQDTLTYARSIMKNVSLPIIVDNLTRDHALLIYKALYWDTANCDQLPAYMQLAVFDAAVNTKMVKVNRWLQMSVGAIVDGNIGPVTIAKIKAADPHKLLREFHAHRAFNFMLQDSIDDEFGLGWGRRLMLVHDTASALI